MGGIEYFYKDIFYVADFPTYRESLIEKLHALLAECDLVMDNAKFGELLNNLDHLLYVEGRNFAKKSSKKNSKNESNNPKATPPCTDCKKTTIADIKPKKILTLHGAVTVLRRYRYCTPCKKRSFPVGVTL